MGIIDAMFGNENKLDSLITDLGNLLERHSNVVTDRQKEGVNESHIKLYEDLENFYGKHNSYHLDKTDSGLTVKSFETAVSDLIDKYRDKADSVGVDANVEDKDFHDKYNELVDIYNKYVERENIYEDKVRDELGVYNNDKELNTYENRDVDVLDGDNELYERDKDLDVNHKDVNTGNLHEHDRFDLNKDKDKDTLQLHEERLRVNKDEVKTGEVKIDKDVVVEKQEFDVPVSHDEVVIERRKVNERVDGDVDFTNTDEEIHIPLTEERINIEKENVVAEELVIKKNKVQDTVHVDETVKKEVVDIDENNENIHVVENKDLNNKY